MRYTRDLPVSRFESSRPPIRIPDRLNDPIGALPRQEPPPQAPPTAAQPEAPPGVAFAPGVADAQDKNSSNNNSGSGSLFFWEAFCPQITSPIAQEKEPHLSPYYSDLDTIEPSQL